MCASVKSARLAFSVRYLARVVITHLFIAMLRFPADEASENCGVEKNCCVENDCICVYQEIYDVSIPSNNVQS